MRRPFGSWRVVRRLFAVALGCWMGTELALWTFDPYPGMDVVDFSPRCR